MIDGAGDLQETDAILEIATRRGLRVRDVQIAPMSMGWRTPPPPGFVKGACAPIDVIVGEREALASGALDLIVVRGTDNVRSEYAERRAERDGLMDVYGPGHTFLSAYTRLGRAFLERHRISGSGVRSLPRCDLRKPLADVVRAQSIGSTTRRAMVRAGLGALSWRRLREPVARFLGLRDPRLRPRGRRARARGRGARGRRSRRAARRRRTRNRSTRSAGFPHLATAVRRATAQAGIDQRTRFSQVACCSRSIPATRSCRSRSCCVPGWSPPPTPFRHSSSTTRSRSRAA